MPDNPKPLTKAELEFGQPPDVTDRVWRNRECATIDALFAYRERTRGGIAWKSGNPIGSRMVNTDAIAADLGLE